MCIRDRSHPAFTPHPIQGWTPDFIPKITEEALQAEVFDEIVQVTGAEAVATSLKMAEMEGLFTGISGGASMAAALKVANDAPEGSVVLTMLPVRPITAPPLSFETVLGVSFVLRIGWCTGHR